MQVPELDARRKEFEALNAQVLDISVDSIPSHMAWRRKISVPSRFHSAPISFPMRR